MKPIISAFCLILINLSTIAQVDSAFAFGLQQQLDGIRSSSSIAGMEVTLIFDSGCELSLTSGVQTGSTPIDTSKLWHVASNTKSLTATVIMLMQEDGLLDIDDPVGLYINTNNWSGIDSNLTIRSILSHTSILGNAWYDGSPLWTAIWGDRDSLWNERDVFLPQFQVPTANPNGDFEYNAFTGYTLLGFMIEEISGNAYADEVATRIFTPMGLSRSKLSNEGVSMSELNGVWSGGQDRSTWSHTSYLSTRGGGGSWCTILRESARYFHTLHFGSVLSPLSMAETRMKVDQTPQIVPGTALGSFEINYGLGSWIWTSRSASDTIVFYGHGGNGLGSVIVAACPEYGFTMAVVSNDFTKVNENSLALITMSDYVIDNMNSQTCQNVSTPEFEAISRFTVYPNPGANLLTLESTVNESSKYQVMTLDGKILLTGEFNGSKRLDVSNLSSGMYIVKFVAGEEVHTVRWVKE
ncbi:MAG: serine hydrolase [Flavobacteriia bacterium]|nr:serine hydrolase [Flavobacteriia bacterium]